MMQYKKKKISVKKVTTEKMLYIAFFYKKHSYIIKNENNILIISIEILYMMTNFI